MQAGVESLMPWLRAPDNRSGRVKYLDTCLALVSEDAMAAWLERQANVDLSQWGRGKAKHVRDLLKEVSIFLRVQEHAKAFTVPVQVLSGESELRSDGTRVVRVAKVRIVDDDFELINTLQVSRGDQPNRSASLARKPRQGRPAGHGDSAPLIGCGGGGGGGGGGGRCSATGR